MRSGVVRKVINGHAQLRIQTSKYKFRYEEFRAAKFGFSGYMIILSPCRQVGVDFFSVNGHQAHPRMQKIPSRQPSEGLVQRHPLLAPQVL